MDAKITLSFDKHVIEKAKQYAKQKNMSLSRLMELLLDKITTNQYASLEDMPVSDWVNALAEGPSRYVRNPKKNSALKNEFRSRKNENISRCQCACFCPE